MPRGDLRSQVSFFPSAEVGGSLASRHENLTSTGGSMQTQGSFPSALILREVKAIFCGRVLRWNPVVFALVNTKNIAGFHKEVIIAFLGATVVNSVPSVAMSLCLNGFVGSNLGRHAT